MMMIPVSGTVIQNKSSVLASLITVVAVKGGWHKMSTKARVFFLFLQLLHLLISGRT